MGGVYFLWLNLAKFPLIGLFEPGGGGHNWWIVIMVDGGGEFRRQKFGALEKGDGSPGKERRVKSENGGEWEGREF